MEYISMTEKGVTRYPPHRHTNWELMTYVEGTGELYTPEKSYPFERGTMLLVPPGTVHGSISENGFCNISVGGDFGAMLFFDKPMSVFDGTGDGRSLAQMLYRNRYDAELAEALCRALLCCFLQSVRPENELCAAVNVIVSAIRASAFDAHLELRDLLCASGYAEDYIRAGFKKYTGRTPTAFLTELRMQRARYLMTVYGSTLPLQAIAERCGFCDYVYFSRRFKENCGLSPREYLKSAECGTEWMNHEALNGCTKPRPSAAGGTLSDPPF